MLSAVCVLRWIANFKNSLLKGALVSRISRSGDNEKAIWHSVFTLESSVAQESFRLCSLMDCSLLPDEVAVIYGVLVQVKLCFSPGI